MEDTDVNVQQLPVLIKEWMNTEDELRTLSTEIREKRKRGKMVKEMILKIMKGNKLGRLNISAGAVTTRTKKSKASITKKYLVETLTDYFGGNKEQAMKCAEFIETNRPTKATDSLTLDPQ